MEDCLNGQTVRTYSMTAACSLLHRFVWTNGQEWLLFEGRALQLTSYGRIDTDLCHAATFWWYRRPFWRDATTSPSRWSWHVRRRSWPVHTWSPILRAIRMFVSLCTTACYIPTNPSSSVATYLPAYLPTYLRTYIRNCIHTSIRPSINRSIDRSINPVYLCPSVCPYLYLPTYLPACLVCLSTCLPVCPAVSCFSFRNTMVFKCNFIWNSCHGSSHLTS